MSGSVDVCNEAISLIRGGSINSLDEGSNEAQACQTHYLPAVRSMIATHEWNFAIREARLAETTQASAEWSNIYALPADCLRVIGVISSPWTSPAPFTVSGRTLKTNQSNVVIAYLALIDDVNQWPPEFREAVVWALAARISMQVTGDPNLRNTTIQIARSVLMAAQASSSNEHQARSMDDAEWIKGR